MKNRMLMTMATAALTSLTGMATDYMLVSSPQSLADWRSDSFYKGNVAPQEDYSATIVIPKGMEVTVDDGTIGFVNAMRWLKPYDDTSVVTLDVSTNSELRTSVASGEIWSDCGRLKKKGEGALALVSTGLKAAVYGDYCVGIEVEEGELVLPKGGYFGGFTIAEGATLVVKGGTSDGSKVTYKLTTSGLNGAGVLTNATDAASSEYCLLDWGQGTSTPSVFSGKILGRIKLACKGNQYLTGIETTVGLAEVYGGAGKTTVGTLGIAKLGMRDESTSSIGSAMLQYDGSDGNGRFVYLGNGETSDKWLSFWGTTGGPAAFDAGASGALHLTGRFRCQAANRVERFWLDGSNVAPCYVEGPWGSDDDNSLTYVTKKGTGTWRFANYTDTDTKRSGLGGFWAQNGVLGFETFNEKTAVGAMGTTMTFIGDTASSISSATTLPYFFRLGNAEDLSIVGLVEYYGTARTISKTRPAAVDGTGGFLSGMAEGAYLHSASGVSALNEKSTLVLDGDRDGQDLVSGLTDGEGTLGVEKRGSGTWTIAGADNSFTGPIDVKAGTLVLRGVSGKFTWFRWTCRGIYSGSYIRMAQFGVWNKENALLSKGLVLTPNSMANNSKSAMEPSKYPRIAPGEICFADTFDHQFSDPLPASQLVSLFNGEKAGMFGSNRIDGHICKEDDPASYWSFVFRLPRSSAEVGSYDLAKVDWDREGSPNSWKFEGSVDGEQWYTIDDVTGFAGNANDNKTWLYAKTAVSAANCATHAAGKKIAGSTNDTVVVYSNPVSVSSGATLEAEGLVRLTSLKVDASAAAGRIKGFILSDTTTVDVTNVPRGQVVELPIAFDDVTGSADVSGWTLLRGGKPAQTLELFAEGGKLYLRRSGSILIVR